MNKVKLFADRRVNLPPELIKRHDITVIPLYVTLGEEGVDGELPIGEIFAYADRTKQTPKTAAVSLEDFNAAFQPIVDNGYDIVYVGLSSKFSSTAANAAVAASEFPAGRVEVVDSLNLSSGIGLLALTAAGTDCERRERVKITQRGGA